MQVIVLQKLFVKMFRLPGKVLNRAPFDRIPVRLRLSLAYAVWMALLFGAIGGGVYVLVRQHLNRSVDAALLSSAESLRSARTMANYRSPFTQSFLREFFGDQYIRPYAQLVDLSGRVSEKTTNMRVTLPVTPRAASRAAQGLATLETIPRKSLAPLRQITLPVIEDGRFTGELIQVGAPLDPTYRTLRSIALMLWIVLPVGLLLSIGMGYILTAYVLKPVRLVTRAASQLNGSDLSRRLQSPPARDEIRELSDTFNSMLDRLQDAFQRMSRFTSDASHELRTPLAVLRGEVELSMRRERHPHEYRETMAKVQREAIHMTKIIEDLLLLARAQNQSVEIEWQKIDIVEFTDALTAAVEGAYRKKQIQLIKTIPDHITFHGSFLFLSLALKNILLNAAKHSPVNGEVCFEVRRDSSQVEFVVIDYGEGIPPQSLPFIFDSFYRCDTARNRELGGSGVGLSLAKALVELHSGRITVESELSKGSVFTVTIPIDPNLLHQNKTQPERKPKNARLLAQIWNRFELS